MQEDELYVPLLKKVSDTGYLLRSNTTDGEPSPFLPHFLKGETCLRGKNQSAVSNFLF